VIARLAPLAALVVLVVACSKEGGGSASADAATGAAAAPAVTGAAAAPVGGGKLLGSCMVAGIACSDYYGASADAVKGVCKSVGTWSDGACPTAGVQGTCTKPEPGGITSKTHTYPPGTKASAKKACDHTPGGGFSG
jgi:hypothetical protein